MWISVKARRACFAREDTEILVQRDKEVQMAVYEFGKDVPFISAVFHILSKMHEFSIEA